MCKVTNYKLLLLAALTIFACNELHAGSACLSLFKDSRTNIRITKKLDGILSSADIALLERVSTDGKGDLSAAPIEFMHPVKSMSLDSKAWAKSKRQSIVVSRLEQLVQVDSRFLGIVEQHTQNVLTRLKQKNATGYEGLRSEFRDSKEVLLLLSEAARVLDFSKSNIKNDLNKLYDLTVRLGNPVYERKIEHPTDRYLAIMNFFEGAKSFTDHYLQVRTDMDIAHRAKIFYADSKLGQQMEALLDQRQNREWISLPESTSRFQGKRVKNLVVNFGWKQYEGSNAIDVFFKGDEGARGIPVIFSKTSQLQEGDLLPLMSTRDLLGGDINSEVSAGSRSYEPTSIERISGFRYFDLPMSVNGVIHHRKGRDSQGNPIILSSLEVESVSLPGGSQLTLQQAIVEYGKWYKKQLIDERRIVAQEKRMEREHQFDMLLAESMIRRPVMNRAMTPEQRRRQEFLIEANKEYPPATEAEIASYQAQREARRQERLERHAEQALRQQETRASNPTRGRGVVSDPDVMNAHDSRLREANERNTDMSILDSEID